MAHNEPKLGDVDEKHTIAVEERAADLRHNAQAVDPREKLSAQFTIAAAAAGLISDGCECFYESFRRR